MICRTTLPPYHFGNLHWACAHVAAFAGAVLGGVGTWAYAVKGKLHNPRGVNDWTVSAQQLPPVLWICFSWYMLHQYERVHVSGYCDRMMEGLHMLLALVWMCQAGTFFLTRCVASAMAQCIYACTDVHLHHPRYKGPLSCVMGGGVC